MARGEEPPPRPKAFFTPNPSATLENPYGTSEAEMQKTEDQPYKARSRRGYGAKKRGFT
jgi:hypothetical protein